GFLAPGIDWRAHLGGLVTGALVATILVHAPRKSRPLIQVAGLSGVLLILVAATMLRTSQIQELLAPLGVITT
ncbi:MAG: rhomboid family intramembrane serine protease, partial [Actinomycetota bacterium]|nr:rhomboid family intramembrane serine protease [Actinomycetota bacterium]